MPLNGSALGFPIQYRRRGRAGWIAISYGVGLTIFLFVAMGQAANAIADYPIEILLCLFNGGLSIYGQLLSLRREASIHFISFFFSFLFMSAAPIVQLGANNDVVFGIDHLALWSAVNALAFTVIGIVFTYRLNKPESEGLPARQAVPSDVNYLLAFLTAFGVSIGAIILFNHNLFTSRSEFFAARQELFEDAPTALLATTFLMSTPLFAAIIGLRSAIANRQKIWIALFSAACLLASVLNNPIIQPRYQLAGLAFFFIDYMFYGKKTKLLAALLIVGVLLGPVFQSFRHSDQIDASAFSEDAKPFSETLLSMDYDAFPMSCYTMLTVDNAGISWGSNILGAVSFFVPRSWWPDKPPPTSWVVYDTMSHLSEVGTNNLSTPLMAEGYYAFGWVGALAISLLYWFLVSEIIRRSRKDLESWWFLLRCVFSGLVLILLRGTLTVGVSALVSYFVAAAIPAFLISHRFKSRDRLLSARSRH